MTAATTVQRAESNDSFIWRFAMIAALSGILFGYDASSINDAIQFIQEDFVFGDTLKGIVVGSLQIGAAVGALLAGFMADRFGRKRTIIISAILFVVGVTLASVSPDVDVLLLARLVIGFAIGVTSAVTPLYVAEISPSDKRGGMVTLYQLAITVGIFIAFLVGYALSGEGNWRLMIFLAVVPAVCQLLFMRMVPESPRFLMTKGRDAEARAVLAKTRGAQESDHIVAEIREVIATEESASYSDIFKRRARPALVAGLGLALIQAFTGINAIMYYSTNIFQVAGFTGGNVSELNSLVIGIVNMATTVVAIRLVLKYRRRSLLLTGTIGMVVSLTIGGLALMLHGQAIAGASEITGWITLVAVIAYVICFAFGLGPLAWVVISEIFPLGIRGRAAALATAGNWFANVIIAVSFPIIVSNSEFRLAIAFFIYALIGLISVAFIARFVPETKDKSLEEIEDALTSQTVEETWTEPSRA